MGEELTRLNCSASEFKNLTSANQSPEQMDSFIAIKQLEHKNSFLNPLKVLNIKF